MVKIDFQFESEFGVYRDAIVLPEDHNFTDEQIESIKQQRFNAWLEAITPSDEDIAVEGNE